MSSNDNAIHAQATKTGSADKIRLKLMLIMTSYKKKL